MSNSGDEHCLEMFHQALLYNDQHARKKFQRRLSVAVRGWLRDHPRREEAHCCENEDYYVMQAFEYFWRATARQKQVELSTLTAVLMYLQASLDGVIIETLRNHCSSRELPIAEPQESGYPGKPFPAGRVNSHEIWENIQSFLSDAREQRLAYLLFHCGLKPREIVQSYPMEYGNLEEIVYLRQNVIERVFFNQGSAF